MAKKQKSKKIATQIADTVEQRIVQVSLENPDFGGGRLVPLLEQEGITVTASTVYSILKRNNLQNRTLRLSRLEAQRAAEIVPKPPDSTEPPADEPAPVPALTGETPLESVVSPTIKAPSKPNGRHPWSLTVPNLLLLGLIGYFWVSALGNLLEARREPLLPYDSPSVAVGAKPQVFVRPLEDYNIIVERNLFGGSGSETPAPEETVSLEGIPAAEKNLGLKLVGTVAGDDSETSFAIIDNKKTRKQELYHEGDKAGEVLIKRILRNNVIVDAGRGEELLVLELEETGKKIEFSPAPQPPVDSQPAATSRIHQNFQLDRQKVDSSLGNVDQLIQQAGISPYVEGERPAGFTITKVEPDSIFAQMGLRNGDAIMGVNDEDITGPEQAGEFLQKLKEGSEVTIKVKKGKGVRRRTRVIRIKIE